jgi:hypothetical protein
VELREPDRPRLEWHAIPQFTMQTNQARRPLPVASSGSVIRHSRAALKRPPAAGLAGVTPLARRRGGTIASTPRTVAPAAVAFPTRLPAGGISYPLASNVGVSRSVSTAFFALASQM